MPKIHKQLVLVRPPYADFGGDRLFSRSDQPGNHWLHPFVALREEGARRGIELHTWDVCPLAEADAILFVDLPRDRSEVERAKRQAPLAKRILQLIETPLGRAYFHNPSNHSDFDAVVSYNPWHLTLNHASRLPRYYHYNICVEPPLDVPELVPFEARQPLVMINSNRWTRFWEVSRTQSGLKGLPFVGPVISGWHMSLDEMFFDDRGELYSARRAIAQAAESFPAGTLDIFGAGWKGDVRQGLVNRLRPPRKYACARGKLLQPKYAVLGHYKFTIAFENKRSAVGYLSEKIFDAMFGGSVPIYLGEERIDRHVPTECFVDARVFSTPEELIRFAVECDEKEWERMRAAGAEFISSQKMKDYLPHAMADTVLSAIAATSNPGG